MITPPPNRSLFPHLVWKYYNWCLGSPKHGDKGDFRPKKAFTCISSAAVVLIIGGGMGYMTGEHGYDGTPPTIWMIIPILTLLLTLLLGIAGYMQYKDLEETEEA